MRYPPTAGPMTLENPKTDPMMPLTRPRRAGGKRSAIVVKAMACEKPPPIPCRPRKATSCGIVVAAPQSALPMTKMATPASRNSLRPYRSESLPTIGTTVVDANR